MYGYDLQTTEDGCFCDNTYFCRRWGYFGFVHAAGRRRVVFFDNGTGGVGPGFGSISCHISGSYKHFPDLGHSKEHNTEEYRIRVEAVIYYYDKEWSDAWGECAGKPIWLPILGSSVSFKAGQRIAIDGWIVPSSQRFVWDKTQVRILQEGVNTKAEPVGNLRDNCAELKDHLVSVEGLIDRQINEPTHIKLTFLNGDTTANAYVLKGTNDPAPGFKEGDFVRMKCVYSPHFDREGNLSALSLWVARPTDIEVIGSVRNDPRFVTPITPIDEIQESSPTNNMIHIAGIVHSHEPGKWVTLWDGTGQVMVQSRQTQPLRTGDRVEAIGYPYVLGVQQTLHGGLCRLMASTNELVSFDNPPFRLVERIRDLNREEARRHSPVILRAVVTWSNPETPFTFVQDASGGIRVANPKWDMPDTSKPGTIVTLRGEVAEGDFVPIVTNAAYQPIRRVESGRGAIGDAGTSDDRQGGWQLGRDEGIRAPGHQSQRFGAFRSKHIEWRISGMDSSFAVI